MALSHEIPSFAVGTQDHVEFHDTLPEDASLVWQDIPNIYAWGDQERYNLLTAEHPMGRVAVIGACFANQESLDSRLAEALERQEPELLTRLPGSYVTILHEQDRLTVMRDVAGMFPVYFTHGVKGVLVSSEPSVVAGGDLIPNVSQAIANLTFLAPNEGSMGGTVSCFDGVGKLMGGQAVSIDRESDYSVYTYEPLTPNLRLTKETAAVELRAALREAVQSRIESGIPISANLSGGVDSSSVVSLALETMDPNKTLPVFFMDNPGQESDDKRFFDSYVSEESQLKPHLFNMSGMPHITHDVPVNGRALTDVANSARQTYLSSYYDAVLEAGAGRLHLTGNGGDEVVAIGPHYLPDLLRKGHIGRFLKEGGEWARIYNTSPYKVWRAMGRIAFHGLKNTLQDAAQRVEGGEDVHIGDPIDSITFWQPNETALNWLTPHARRTLKEYLMERADNIDISEADGIGNFIAKERIRAAGSDQGLEMRNVPPGISLHSPFLDHNVIRAASAMDATLKGSPYEFKLLLREALKDIAPEYILNRPSKGVYGPASRERHFEALSTLNELLDDSALVRLGLIDPSPIRKELARLEMIPPTTMWALTQVLITERWLRSFDLSNMSDDSQDSMSQPAADEMDMYVDTPLDVTKQFVVPAYIHFVGAKDGSLLAFNQKTDQYHPLTVTQSNALRLLAYSGDVQQAIDQFIGLYPAVSQETLTADAMGIMKTFQDLGIITPGVSVESRLLPIEKPPRFVSEEFHTAHVEDDTRGTRLNRSLAMVALMGTEIINRVMPHKRKSLLDGLQKWATQPARQEDAKEVLQAVQSSKYIGRVACLQASYAAAVALALKGKKAEWHIGASFSPLDIHAWIEADDEPVRTTQDGRVMGNYQSFFS
jgi:asparagine synthase (glutamine-hydrolysing)